MKKLFVSQFIIVLCLGWTQSLFAITCDELQSELKQIDGLIQSTKPRDCTDTIKKNCCDKDVPESCNLNHSAKARYNDAIAKITIIEGLIAIGQKLENSHNKVVKIDETKIDDALENINDFYDNFARAKLIKLSLDITRGSVDTDEKKGTGDKSIWDDYKGKDTEDVLVYLKKSCEKKKNPFKKFCKEFDSMLDKAHKKDDKKMTTMSATEIENFNDGKVEEILQSLHGFAMASHHVLKTNRNSDYRKYQRYLKVQVGDSDAMDIDSKEFKEKLGPVSALRAKLLEYKKTKISAKQKKKLEEDIFKLSHKIDKLNVNYQEGEQLPIRFDKFAEINLRKEITKIKSASGYFLNLTDTKNNLDSIHETLGVDIASKKLAVNDKAYDLVKTSMGSYCNEGEDAQECIVRACDGQGSNIPETCPQNAQNKDFFAAGLNSVFDQMKSLNQMEKMSDALKSLNECMGQTIAEVNKCIGQKVSDLGLGINPDQKQLKSQLDVARSELASAKEILEHNSGSKNIKELEILKALGVVKLQTQGCNANLKETTPLTSACNTEDVLNHSKSFVTFADDNLDAVISYNKSYVNQMYKDQKKTARYDASLSYALKFCDNNPDIAYEKLCQTIKNTKKISLENRPILVDGLMVDRLASRGDRYKARTDIRNAAIIKGIGQTAVYGVAGGLQMAVMTQQTKATLDYYNTLSDQNKTWNEYYRKNPYYYGNSNMNWGYDYWSPYYASTFQYQSSNQVYYNTIDYNFSQFTFPPATLDTGNAISPIGPSPAASGNGNYLFNFST